MSAASSKSLVGVGASGFAFTWPCASMAGGRPTRPACHCEAAFRFEAIMMVVAEAPVVKVASEPVLIIATPVVYSGPNEEYTEGCHSSDGAILTLPILVRFIRRSWNSYIGDYRRFHIIYRFTCWAMLALRAKYCNHHWLYPQCAAVG